MKNEPGGIGEKMNNLETELENCLLLNVNRMLSIQNSAVQMLSE